MEKYTFEKAYNEGYEIRKKARELKLERGENGEPSKDDYVKAEFLVKKNDEKNTFELQGEAAGVNKDNIPQVEKIPDLENVEARVAHVYETLGSYLGSNVVEANAVLTIAGFKPMTDLHYVELKKEDVEKITKTKDELAKIGLYVHVHEYPGNDNVDVKVVYMSLENREAFKQKAQNITIPGVPKYDPGTGEDGIWEWGKNLENNIERSKKEGLLSSDVNESSIIIGICLGYPDQAILDFEKCLRIGDIHKDLIDSDDILEFVPKNKGYRGSQPVFSYYPEHRNNSEIVNYIETSRIILKNFYESPWFKKIEKDPEFKKNRKYNKQVHQKTILKNMHDR